jgi:hypothetical protein
MGDQHLPKHSRRQITGLQRRITKMNAPLETRLERSLAAPSGMDLSLDDDSAATLFRGDLLSLFGCEGDATGLRGNAKLGEKLPGLVFVNVH